MKKVLVLALITTSLVPSGFAAVSYNQNITAIFGTGNPNTGWTVDSENGLELGLRAKNRVTASTANTLGTYSYATAPATRGLWNYEFSIGSGTATLDQYDFYLAADHSPSQGAVFSVTDPLTHWVDNSFGTGITLNGQGVEGLASVLAGANTVVQNSQNITFGDYPGGGLALNPNATYSYELFAVAKGTGAGGTRLADVGITVQVGQGGSVPDTTPTVALLGLSMLGMAAMGLRKQTLTA